MRYNQKHKERGIHYVAKLHSRIYFQFKSKNLLASLYTCLISLDDKSHEFNSAEINSGYFLLISLKAFPTDFRTYHLYLLCEQIITVLLFEDYP